MSNKHYKGLLEAYTSIYEQPVIASSGSQLGVVDKKDGKVVQGTFRVPTDADLEKVNMQKYVDSPAGKAFLQKKEADKAAGTFKTPGSPGSKISTSSTSTSTSTSSATNTPVKNTTPTTPSAPSKSFQQELDDLRKASAQATMAGPSKEAQALMSDRAKRMLGADKLKAGIAGQERVQRMMSGTPKPTSAPTSTTAPTPRPRVQPGDFGTTMGPGPTFKGGPVPPPITRQSPQTRVPDRSASYQRAWDNRNNPLAKGRIRDTWSKMSPEERTAAKEWAKANNKNWQEMGLPESVDVYDQVLNFLLNEGCTLEESNYIMTYVVEQGMHPQEIVARGIANILGLDKPHPTEIFARGLKKMLYPNKPVEVKAPKPPAKPAVKPAAAKPAVKPNPYRPGATIRATGPNMDRFPELQRFADQGRKIAEPVVRTAGALSALRNITPAGVAAAVMAPRPTGDATLTAAMKRGDVAPPAPKLPAPEKPKPVGTTKPTAKPTAKPAAKPVAKPAAKPAAAKPETPKFGPIPPLPPIEKKPSIADTLKDIRGSIEKSKERQKESPNK